MLVYVLNKHGEPLMPCRPAKARLLLKEGKAGVVKRTPFTIRLKYGSSGYKQPVTLGVDSGSQHAGFSASTEKHELYAAEVELRPDISELLSTRREARRTRRNRKTRYREARFLNRVHSKNKGWLAPSVENKIETHLKVIRDARKFLPITKIVIETASFDIQKIRNPEISGTEYQQGEQLGFWNVREYVLARDGHKCQYCGGKSGDKILNVHHIESRKTGGDAPNNLVTLCETCHKKYHAGKISLSESIQRGESFIDAAAMSVMRWTLYDRLREEFPSVQMSFGYLTKNTRIQKGLPKEHCIDAYCIAGNLNAELSDSWFYIKQVRRSNRQIHKFKTLPGGIRKLNQSPKYVKGFQLYDEVLYKSESYFIFGRRASGYFDIRKLDGTKVNGGSVSSRCLRLLSARNSLLTERRTRAPLTTKVTSLRAGI